VSARCALGIDVGTSGPKAAVVSVEGDVLGASQCSITTHYLPDGGAEQDPREMWEAVKIAMVSALSASGVRPADVAAVLVSSQFSSVVPVGATGEPVGNFIIWADRRGAKKRLRHLPGYPSASDTPLQLLRWLWIAGVIPVANSSLGHVRFLKYSRPEIYEQAKTFLEPMDYIALRLTGRATANQCTAWPLLVTDNRRQGDTRYHPSLVAASLIDEEKLPDLVPLDSIIGPLRPEVAEELGLHPSVPVVTGVNDTLAGAMGTGAFTGTHAGMQVGSTSLMLAHLERKRTDPLTFLYSIPSPVPGKYCMMAENGMGGAALDRVLSNLIYCDDAFGSMDPAGRYQALSRAVEETPVGSDGLLFLPWLDGSLAPKGDDRVRGGFLNISNGTTRSHFARAVLEGVAMNMRWLLHPAEKFVGQQFSHLRFYGGGATSEAWCRIMADCLGLPIRQVAQPLYTGCIGDALLAFQRLGMLSFDEIPERVRVRRVFEPIASHTRVYDEQFEQFRRAFKANRSIFRALNGPSSEG
jgi:xylulokinase